MNIIKASKEQFDMHELYNLTMTPEAQRLSDHKEEVIDIEQWAVYGDINSDGEAQQLLSILTPEGEVYATNSKTFQDSFLKIVDLSKACGEPFTKVKVSGGVSKNGREYITAVLG